MNNDLMKPRYKLIADWPGCELKVGHIFYKDDHVCKVFGVTDDGWHSLYTKYPHLFKKLEWHEDRRPEEMPEYVKRESEFLLANRGKIYKCRFDTYTSSPFYMYIEGDEMPYSPSGWMIATETEYNEYLKTKTP